MKKIRQHSRTMAVLSLALIILFSGTLPALALDSGSYSGWPEFTDLYYSAWVAQQAYVTFDELDATCYFNSTPAVTRVTLPAGASLSQLTPEKFTFAEIANNKPYDSGVLFEEHSYAGRRRIKALRKGPEEYPETQIWRYYDAATGDYLDSLVVGCTDSSEQAPTVDVLDAWTERAEKLISVMREYDELFDTLVASQKASSVQVGAYHPADMYLAFNVAWVIQGAFGFSISWPDNHDYWVAGDGWANATKEDLVRHWKEYKCPGSSKSSPYKEGDKMTLADEAYLDTLLDVVAPYYLDYINTQHRIKEPVIDSFAIGSSCGKVDKENRTVTIRMPQPVNWDETTPFVGLADGLQAKLYARNDVAGIAYYRITPWDSATGTAYDGLNTTLGFGVNLSKDWQVKVIQGTPYNYAVSFAVKTKDGKTRYAAIEEGEGAANGKISLNLPVGTALTSIIPIVGVAGEGYKINGEKVETPAPVNFTDSADTPVVLTVYNEEYNLETKYDVSITAEKSSACDILSYRLGGAEGIVGEDRVDITIPYAMDLSKASPKIGLSEFANVTAAPSSLKAGENAYTVTAENGAAKNYTVIIMRTPVSKECKITSFKYGGYAAEIDHVLGKVNLTVPRGIPTAFAPAIVVSEFANVSPASGVRRDFSSPAKYTVTAQNGSTNTYTVTVSVSEEIAANPHKGDIQALVYKILARYQTGAQGDWEWMNLGLFENKLENYNAGQEHDFPIAEKLSRLDTTTNVAMTELDRTIMMLTARGFDCSNLAKYNGGKPFKDSSGKDVDNLVANLYNYSGTYTINGPVFALIALDMGNYTIPEDAVWTRAALLEKLLNHTYKSDGFGLDMVAMLMQAIAPYQNDEVYAARVKDKLNDGLAIIKADMTESYTFGWGGDINSETAAQVIVALCSMGIDCHIDPSFCDGTGSSVLSRWLELFADIDAGYFHHTAAVRNNAMATEQGCYAGQCYLNFLEGGGQGKPYYLYYNRFDFEARLSEEADITAFALEGMEANIAEAAGSDGKNAINITLPKGSPLSNIVPKLTLSSKARLIAPNLPITFVENVPQPFTVQAEDGKTRKIYYVTVCLDESLQAAGTELDVDSIRVTDANQRLLPVLEKSVTAGSEATDILLTLDAGTDVSRLRIGADISYKAVATPALDGKTTIDFADWQKFTVLSEDGKNTGTYRIKAVAKRQASIEEFSLAVDGKTCSGTIDDSTDTITVSDVDDSKLSSTVLVPDIVLGAGTTVCNPLSGTPQDFSRPVSYTVSGDNLVSRTYTVNVLNVSGKPISVSTATVPVAAVPVATVEIVSLRSLAVQLWDAVVNNSNVVEHQVSRGRTVR